MALGDMMGLMKQAAQMKQKMQDVQAELETLEVTGESGGGLVRVTMTAKFALKNLAIDASLLKPEDREMVEDLVVTAHEDARRKAERLAEEKIKEVTAGLPLPPGFKLPF